MPSNSSQPPAPALQIRVSNNENVTEVVLSGRLTAEVAASFKARVKGMIPDCRRMVIDLGEVTFIDSSGLGALVSIYVGAKSGRVDLEWVNLNKQVRQLLSLTRVLSLFEPCGQTNVKLH
jgi:anti-anti-sigma factor